MLRKILKYILIMVVVLGILAGVGLYVAMRPVWVRERIRDIVAQELANRTDREVQVGDIEGNLLTGIVINDLAIAEKEHLSEGVVLGVERVRIKYNLPAVLRGEVAAAASVKQIDLYRPYVKIIRDETGTINLTRIFPPAEVPIPPEKRFAGKVIIHDAVLDFEDPSLAAQADKSLSLRFTKVEGEISVNPYGPLAVTLQASSDDQRFAALELEVQADTEKKIYSLEGSVAGLDVPWWYAVFVASPEFQLTGGQVDGSFSFWSMPTDGEGSDIGYFAQAAISDGRAMVSALSPGELAFSGKVCVTPEGVVVEGLNAQWAGAQLQASGTLFDLANPAVDLAVSVRGLDSRRLAAVLPGDVREHVPEVTGLGSIAIQVQIVGGWPHLSLHVAGGTSQQLNIVEESLGEVSVVGLEFEAQMPDSAQPAVLAQVQVGEVATDPIVLPVGEEDQTPHIITVSPVGGLQVDLLYAGETPVLETVVTVDEVTLDEVTVANLEASIQGVGETVRIEGLKADAWGGHITGHALIENAFAEVRTVHFDGLAQDIDLAALRSLPFDLPEDLGGRANVLFAGSMAGDSPEIIARAHVRGLRAASVSVDEIVGLAELHNDIINVPLVQVNDPKGLVWVQGRVDGDRNITGRVAAAEVNLGALGPLFNQPELGGVAYLVGEIGGNLDEPEGQVELVAFQPHYQDYGADVVTATAGGNLDDLNIEELWVARGSAIVTGQAQLTNLDLEEFNADLGGDLKLVGLRMEEIAELVGRELPVTGRAEGQVALGGTLRRPSASGKLHLVQGSYDEYSLDNVNLSFELAGDVLTFREATIQTQEAVIQAAGKVWDMYDQPQYTAQLTARKVYLQDIVPLQKGGLQLAGEVEIPWATIESSETGLVGEGRLVAPHITIANEEIRDLDTLVTLQEGQVRLQRTALQVAGGELEGEASYEWEKQELAADVSMTTADIPRLLRLAAALAPALGSEESENGNETVRVLRGLSMRCEGELSVGATVAGSPQDLQGQVQLELAGISLDRKKLPEVVGQFSVSMADGELVALTDIDMVITQGEGSLFLTGEIEPQGELDLVADAASFNLALWREWLPPQIKVGGTMGLTVVAQGPTRSPRLKGSIDVLNATFQGVRFDLVSVPVATVTEGRINIDTLILKREEQQIVMDGYLPFTWNPPGIPVDEEMKFAAKLENTDLSFFPPLIDEFIRGTKEGRTAAGPTVWADLKTRGEVNSEMSVTGGINDPVLEGYLKVTDAKVGRPDWKRPVEDININLQLTRRQRKNMVDIAEARARWDNSIVELGGQVHIDYLTGADMMKNQINLSLRVAAAQQRLWPGTTMRNLGGEVTLVTQPEGGHLLTLKEIGGKLGRGSVYVTGTSELTKFGADMSEMFARLAENETDIRLVVDNAHINYAGMYDGIVEGVITVQNPEPEAPMHIGGMLTMRNARLGAPAGGGGGEMTLQGPDASFPAPTFDLAVAIGPDVAFSSAGVNAPLRPTKEAVVITGTPQRPNVRGRVEVEPGRTKVPTGAVNITELGVEYRLGPTPTSYTIPVELAFAAEVWGSAEQIVSSALVDGQPMGPIHIHYEISGHLPEGIKVRPWSEPPLSEDQIYAIAGTAPFAGLATTGPPTGISQMVSKQFMGLLAAGFRAKIFEPLEEQLRRTLGLSEFSVHFAFDQPLEVRIGRYVVKDFLVSYHHSVISETTDKWDLGLSYELPRRLHVSYSTNESGEALVRVGRTYQF